MKNLKEIWQALLDPNIRDALGFMGVASGSIIAAFWAIYKWRKPKPGSETKKGKDSVISLTKSRGDKRSKCIVGILTIIFFALVIVIYTPKEDVVIKPKEPSQVKPAAPTSTLQLINDSQHGLMWWILPNPGNEMKWRIADSFAGTTNMAGFNDWRLPTYEEFTWLHEYLEHTQIEDLKPNFYWTDASNSPTEAKVYNPFKNTSKTEKKGTLWPFLLTRNHGDKNEN